MLFAEKLPPFRTSGSRTIAKMVRSVELTINIATPDRPFREEEDMESKRHPICGTDGLVIESRRIRRIDLTDSH